MQSGVLGEEYKYDLTEPKFQEAFKFLKRTDLATLEVGWYDLPHGVRASVQHYGTVPAEELDFETHIKYFDVHYMVTGNEKVGVVNAKCLVAKTAYDEATDMQYYQDPPMSSVVLLQPGDYIVVAPEDAHKPHIAADTPEDVIKIVVKVPV